MAHSIRRFVSLTLALSCTSLCTPAWAEADALFQSDETLKLEIRAPFDLLAEDKDKSKKYPGTLIHGDDAFDIELEVRGNKRLSKCKHPPLRVNFKKAKIDDTLFDKQDGIKLAVKCEDADRYNDYLRKEYLVYKLLNRLTDVSYRVRWAEIAYIDTETEEARTEPGFFVERKSRVAQRLGLETTDVESIDVASLEPNQAALITLFQYVVANPDYSIIAPPPGDECCHNAKLLQQEDVYYPIIYDFDSTGVVDASYAEPDASLGIDEVTDRLYRGYCEHNPHIIEARNRFVAERKQLISMFDSDPLLGERAKTRAIRFLDRSLDHLASDHRFNREIIRQCR